MDWKPAGRVCLRSADSGDPNPFAAQFHRNGGDQRGCYFALSGHWGGGDTTNPNHPVYFIYFKYCVFSWDDRIIGGNGIPFASVSSSSIGYGAVYLYCYFAAVLRSFGDTVFQMLAMLVCTVLNGALDPLLIHGFGLQGAAAATVLSQGICLGFMVCYLRKKALFSFHAADWSGKEFGAVCLKSLPAAFQQSIPAISTSVLTAIVSGFGVTALAAYGVAGKLELLLFYPAMSFQMVLTTIVGQCIGAGRHDRAWVYCKTALLWGGGLLIILSCGVVGLAHPLSELFVDSKAVAEVVAGYFQVVSVGYLFNMETNCFLGAVNGMGHPGRSMLCMVLYYLIIRIPLACLLSSAGLNGIWAAVLCSHVAAVVTACLLARGLASRKKSPI